MELRPASDAKNRSLVLCSGAAVQPCQPPAPDVACAKNEKKKIGCLSAIRRVGRTASLQTPTGRRLTHCPGSARPRRWGVHRPPQMHGLCMSCVSLPSAVPPWHPRPRYGRRAPFLVCCHSLARFDFVAYLRTPYCISLNQARAQNSAFTDRFQSLGIQLLPVARSKKYDYHDENGRDTKRDLSKKIACWSSKASHSARQRKPSDLAIGLAPEQKPLNPPHSLAFRTGRDGTLKRIALPAVAVAVAATTTTTAATTSTTASKHSAQLSLVRPARPKLSLSPWTAFPAVGAMGARDNTTSKSSPYHLTRILFQLVLLTSRHGRRRVRPAATSSPSSSIAAVRRVHNSGPRNLTT